MVLTNKGSRACDIQLEKFPQIVEHFYGSKCNEFYLPCRKRIKLFQKLMLTKDVKEVQLQLTALKNMNEGMDSEETSLVSS